MTRPDNDDTFVSTSTEDAPNVGHGDTEAETEVSTTDHTE